MAHLNREQVVHLADLKAVGYDIKIHWRFTHGEYNLAKFMTVQQIWFDDEGIWFHTDTLFKINAQDVNVDEVKVVQDSEYLIYDWESIEVPTKVSTGGQDA
jgi:hypothetical protein